MKRKTSSKYINTYLAQTVSILVRFLSMFVVSPLLASQPAIFGTYMVCMSVTIFLTYADVGFFSSAQKKAGEAFGRNNIHEEADQIGFAGFILGIFLVLYIAGLSACIINPALVVKNVGLEEARIARTLFTVLALFSPVTIANRLVGMIFIVRIEGYISQIQQIVVNTAVIISALFFFRPGHYDIIGYFLFSNLMQAAALVFQIIAAALRYRYPFRRLLSAVHFNKRIFNESRGLAFTAFYNSLCWVLFFELDLFVVGRVFGAESAAIFGVAVTITSFFRTLTGGLIFTPFQAQFFQLSAREENEPLASLWGRSIILTAPVVVLPILAVFLYLDKLIPVWVGGYYMKSITIARLFVLCYIFHFIIIPSNFILFARERLRNLNIASTVNVFVYWIGIALTFNKLGLAAFGIFKILGFWFPGAVNIIGVRRIVSGGWWKTARSILFPLVASAAVIVFMHLLINPVLPDSKGRKEMLAVLLATGGTMVTGLSIYCLTCREALQTVVNALHKGR